MIDNIDIFLSGERLYGNDFSRSQLEAWYEGEKEGYAGIVKARDTAYKYEYHQMNVVHGFRHIQIPEHAKALGLGSAYCDEFLPIVERLSLITAVEPSEELFAQSLEGIPIRYVRPTLEGNIPLEDNQFDIVTSFGVLHHIANVSFVITECHRCLKPGGVMLLREPVVSMGDWRFPRRGLTRNERGIPLNLLRQFAEASGFVIERAALLDFPPFVRAMSKLGRDVYDSEMLTRVDSALSVMFSFNRKYHRTRFLEKFGPATAYLILRKC